MRPDLPAVSTAGLARSRRAATAVLLGLGSLAAPPRATLAACAPRRGRLMLMPHACPHSAAPVESVPKLLIRGEVLVEPP